MDRLLVLALKSGSALAVEAVIKRGFDPEATDKTGRTALHLAAKVGSLKICDLLVDWGCRPEVKNYEGLTCIEVASLAGHNELAMAFQALSEPLEPTADVSNPNVKVVSASPIGEVEVNTSVKEAEIQWEIAETDPILFEINDWEVDEEAVKPIDTGVLATVWQSSRDLLQPTISYDFDASWDDVKFAVSNTEKSVKGAKTATQWPKEFSESVSEWLSNGWAFSADIEQQKPMFRKRDWPQIKQGLILALDGEAVSTISNEFDPWAGALSASQSTTQHGKLNCDEDFLVSMQPAENADEWWERKVSQISFLSRFNEEAILNKLVRSRREIVHALALSPSAMRIILKRLDDTFFGEKEFSEFSDADLDLVGEIAGEEPTRVKFPNTHESEVGLSLLCPDGTDAAVNYMAAIDRLDEKYRNEKAPIFNGAKLQEIARDISILRLSPSYLRCLANELSQKYGESILASEIERRLDESDASRKKLIVCHLPRALVIAKKFKGRGLDLEDLFQVAAQGVMRSLATFDPERGTRFWTLAQFWVRQSIGRAIDNEAGTVRIPVHVQIRLRLITRAREDLSKGNLELFNDAQIAEKTGLKISAVIDANDYLVRRLGEENCPNVDTSENAAEEKVSAYQIKHLIENYLQILPDRQQDILARRFGLRGLEEQTLEQIGQRYGVTRERIRQLESKALARLSHPSRLEELRELLKNV